MKLFLITCLLVVLGACSAPNFVGDARPVPVTASHPDHFNLPARFAVARVVYARPQAAGVKEAELWKDLAHRAKSLGTFAPLVIGDPQNYVSQRNGLIKAARAQRYDYLLMVRMDPATGSANVALVHAGSGGVMATAQAVSPAGGGVVSGGDISVTPRS